VASYLTIPEVTEAEDIIAFSRGLSDHSFVVVINLGNTATWLFRAAADGSIISLAIIVTDNTMIALDDVVVSAAASAGGTEMTFTFDAGGVRFV
jgi:hypothetical protein